MTNETKPQRVMPPDPFAMPTPPEAHAECRPPVWDGIAFRCPDCGVPIQRARDPYVGPVRRRPQPVPVTASQPRRLATREPTTGVFHSPPPPSPSPPDAALAELARLQAENERLAAQLRTTAAELADARAAPSAVDPPTETVLMPASAAEDTDE